MSYNFREIVPYEYVYNLFTEICCKKHNSDIYIFNGAQFKKLKMNNELDKIIEEIKPYYKPCRSHYMNTPIVYKKFVTMLRQLSKIHNISYSKKVNYIHGSYDIEYFFEL